MYIILCKNTARINISQPPDTQGKNRRIQNSYNSVYPNPDSPVLDNSSSDFEHSSVTSSISGGLLYSILSFTLFLFKYHYSITNITYILPALFNNIRN